MTNIKSIVVGGGLAGSAFAIQVARHDGRVMLLERTAGPHHKVCGEFLSNEAQELLGELGLDVWKVGAAPASYLGLEFGQYKAKIKLPFCGAGLSRFRLDQLLLDAAAQSGVKVIRGATVTKLQYDRCPIVVHTASERLEATHVALASGKHNVRGLPRPQSPTLAFKMQLTPNKTATDALDHLVHLSLFARGYAGACLVEDGIATIGWVIDCDQLEITASSGWQVHAEFLSERSSFFSSLLSNAAPLWNRPLAVAAIPYGFIRKRVISENIYPVGDQLAVIPSYTGDGTSLALHTGFNAARAVLRNRSAGDFQEATIAKLKPQMFWAKLANFAFVNASAQRLTAAVARQAPWLLPQVAAIVVNKTRLRP
jgi:flavin-dependent dehydrogenase